MPAEHDGSEFTFSLNFSENVEAGYAAEHDRQGPRLLRRGYHVVEGPALRPSSVQMAPALTPRPCASR